jgi:hypothetical protein
MEDKLVPVGEFSSQQEAHLVRIELEEAGIDAIVEEDTLFEGVFPFPNTAGIKVMVRPEDLEQARQVIADMEASVDESEFEDEEQPEKEKDDEDEGGEGNEGAEDQP